MFDISVNDVAVARASEEMNRRVGAGSLAGPCRESQSTSNAGRPWSKVGAMAKSPEQHARGDLAHEDQGEIG